MARPLQDGLLYFPFDTDFFQDKKIKILRGRYGSNGVMLYLYLLCEIYNNGYYIILDEDLILCISDDLNMSEDSTRQIISFLLGRSLLCEIKDSTLAKSDAVLTAESIQRRYQEAKKGLRRDVVVKAKYWILSKDETLSFIKVRPEKDKSSKNDNKYSNNADKSCIYDTKESKVKESKVNYMSDCIPTALDRLSQEQYNELVSLSDSVSVDKYIDKIIAWQTKTGKLCKDPYATIKAWIAKDGKAHTRKDTSYDLDEWEKYAINFDPTKGGSHD